MNPTVACPGCGAELEPTALSCSSCHALTRSKEIESLAGRAKEAALRKDLSTARTLWEECAALLPTDTVQFQSVRSRIAQIDSTLSQTSQPQKWGGRAAGLGPALLVLFSKGKLLLLGLTKLGTLLSMIAFAGVYWALYGWAFALGMVFSIYVHEMGHVLTLRRFGIPADAPMFIPGLGAFIRLRRLAMTRVQDSRVGLAGPIYGLGAAIVALAMSYGTGFKVWAAIAHFGAVINLFNLIPIWQLDGSRGFASLTRSQRLIILTSASAIWLVSSEPELFLIALAAVFRLFTKDASPEQDRMGLLNFIGLLVALTAVAFLAQSLAK